MFIKKAELKAIWERLSRLASESYVRNMGYRIDHLEQRLRDVEAIVEERRRRTGKAGNRIYTERKGGE